jgi:hypothetical protein
MAVTAQALNESGGLLPPAHRDWADSAAEVLGRMYGSGKETFRSASPQRQIHDNIMGTFGYVEAINTVCQYFERVPLDLVPWGWSTNNRGPINELQTLKRHPPAGHRDPQLGRIRPEGRSGSAPLEQRRRRGSGGSIMRPSNRLGIHIALPRRTSRRQARQPRPPHRLIGSSVQATRWFVELLLRSRSHRSIGSRKMPTAAGCRLPAWTSAGEADLSPGGHGSRPEQAWNRHHGATMSWPYMTPQEVMQL